MRARNVELLSERDTLRLGGSDGDGGGGGGVEVQDLIQGYIQEIEELRYE